MRSVEQKLELAMYGILEEDIREVYMNSITAKLSGLETVVAGILSDCQEIIAVGGSDQAIRRQLNIAKFILFEMLDQRREDEDLQARYRKKLASLKDIPMNYGKEEV